eukprot:GHUV01011657.1.p1 GENE.GHUV01011657.1~~GHUV01011657.1.p1  ORF type:complete len:164 (-),score=42.37 GHUV01011657.1:1117-1608(-)
MCCSCLCGSAVLSARLGCGKGGLSWASEELLAESLQVRPRSSHQPQHTAAVPLARAPPAVSAITAPSAAHPGRRFRWYYLAGSLHLHPSRLQLQRMAAVLTVSAAKLGDQGPNGTARRVAVCGTATWAAISHSMQPQYLQSVLAVRAAKSDRQTANITSWQSP